MIIFNIIRVLYLFIIYKYCIKIDSNANFLYLEEDKFSNKKSTNKKAVVNYISSDVESNNKYNDEISDCTSLTSNNSIKEMTDIPIISENKNKDFDKYGNVIYDPKKMYQDFVKVCLKVKFEKLHNTHSGRDVPEKILFKECLKKEILQSEWYSFILNELQSPHKYSQYKKNNQILSKKGKLQKNIR